MSEAVLELEGITRRFGGGEGALTILDQANLQVRAGELVALTGPSGCGKSTLLQIAGLLDTPQRGIIRLAGQAVPPQDHARAGLRLRRIGFVYQFHHLLKELSARENVALPLRLAGIGEREALARADAMLDRLGLAGRALHLPAALSGGERQRVAIARALANRPLLLLADEPTGSLDPQTAQEVLHWLLELARQENVAALIATHNATLADNLTRRVTIARGQITELP